MSARFVSETIAHWEDVYRARSAEALSWYQAEPGVSLELIEGLGIGPVQPVLDVGGGTSLLAARLLHRGFGDVTVLHLSASALAKTRAALGCFADCAALLEQDVLEWSPPRRYALWHDRAVFHFLVDARDRRRYLACLREASRPGRGRDRDVCAGRPGPVFGIAGGRYGPTELATTLGAGFAVVSSRREEHRTPRGAIQPFTWLALRARS